MSLPTPTPQQARILWTSLTALALGILLGLTGLLLWGLGWVLERLSSILLPLAIWIYMLVFAFSSLWFTHYCLSALHALRAEKALAVAAAVAAAAASDNRKATKFDTEVGAEFGGPIGNFFIIVVR